MRESDFPAVGGAVLLSVLVLALPVGLVQPGAAAHADPGTDLDSAGMDLGVEDVWASHTDVDEDRDEEEDDEDEEDDEGDTIVNIDLDEVVDAIQNLIQSFEDFTGNLGELLKDVLIAVFFEPFRRLAEALIEVVVTVLTTTPDIYPNPAVEEVHREALLVSIVLSGLGFTVAGLLYQVGPILGISYRQVRMILPRLVIALVFSTVSLQLLQLGVELSNALVHAFKPDTLGIAALAGLSTSLVLVWLINALLLLVLAIIFIIRNVYLLFVAAISPLLAFAWVFPRSKRYADTFIAGWFTALAMAPLDVLVLRFNLALLEGTGNSALQGVTNWVLGVASFVLLIWVPYQLYGASQAAVGQAYLISRGVQKRIHEYRQTNSQQSLNQQDWDQGPGLDRRNGAENKFDYDWGDDD